MAKQHHLHVIIDDETRALLDQRQKQLGLNLSEAARDALLTGLGSLAAPEVRGIRIGIQRGKVEILRTFGETMSEALEKAAKTLKV